VGSKVLGAVLANLLWMGACVAIVVGAGVMLAAHRDPVRPSAVPVPAVHQGHAPSPARLLPFITRRVPMSRHLM
jgi:hypothetical protein